MIVAKLKVMPPKKNWDKGSLSTETLTEGTQSVVSQKHIFEKLSLKAFLAFSGYEDFDNGYDE